MMKTFHSQVRVLCVGGMLLAALVGCGSSPPKMTAQEKADFKGGPMPESAQKIVAERMRQAQQHAAPNAGKGN